jgi:hypothetical protein
VYHLRIRQPRHTGEHVAVEPLARFLLRYVHDEPVWQLPAAPTPRTPSLQDYDREGCEEVAA